MLQKSNVNSIMILQKKKVTRVVLHDFIANLHAKMESAGLNHKISSVSGKQQVSTELYVLRRRSI